MSRPVPDRKFVTADSDMPELTVSAVAVGVILGIVFGASSLYLALRVGMTVSASIPVAVMSITLFRTMSNRFGWRRATILENNIVQTQASAAGTLSAVIFVLPALLMMGYWTGFPLLQTAMICACGGILGVVFTVPLRRALVVNSDLPYPEGVAAAEILKVGQNPGDGAGTRQAGGLRDIVAGGVLAGGFSLMTSGLRIAGDSVGYWFTAGRAVFQLPLGLSFALVGAGYLVGIVGGVAMLLGVVLSWGVAVPWLTSLAPMPDGASLSSFATGIWVSKVRLIGAGMIAVAAVWTLLTLIKPMIEGMRISLSVLKRGSGASGQDRTDADLPPGLLLKLTLFMILLLGATFQSFVADSGLPALAAWTLVVTGVLLAFVFGFLVAAACGYMAGLVGSSASPISGIAVIAILASSMIFIGIGQTQDLLGNPESVRFMTALALFCTSVVVAVAAISNDNLQDLKTGWLVHATPWRQQTALIIGCVIGAVTIPPVLELLYEAYGFIGSLPREGMDPTQALAAPQASLMITIAQGLFSHTLDWTYIRIGVLVGAALIVFDWVLGRFTRFRVPPLAVAMGVYLPPTVATALFVGALISWFARIRIRARTVAQGPGRVQAAEQASERTGTLFASGLIVGESLVGVVLAIVIVGSMASGGGDAPLALAGPGFAPIATGVGLLAFVLMCIVFVRRVLGAARSG